MGNIFFEAPKDKDFVQATLSVRPGESITLKAAKLELVGRQTLAHKESDAWVLNDPPPNKTLELMKCQRYQQVLDAKVGYTPYGTGYGRDRKSARVFVPILNTLGSSPSVSTKGKFCLGPGNIPISSITKDASSPNVIALICTVEDNKSLTPNNFYYLAGLDDTSTQIILDANI